MTTLPNEGTVLTKEQVIEYILKNLEEAKINEENGFENLRTIYEASFGFCCDAKLGFDDKQDKFIAYELTNYN
jgi:hypothetical protein